MTTLSACASSEAFEKFISGEGGAICLDGKYLYAVSGKSLCTFDVSVPDKPQMLHQTPAAGNRQMVKSGACLYLSCRACGVQVFSLKDPACPVEINRFYPVELATGLTAAGLIFCKLMDNNCLLQG